MKDLNCKILALMSVKLDGVRPFRLNILSGLGLASEN